MVLETALITMAARGASSAVWTALLIVLSPSNARAMVLPTQPLDVRAMDDATHLAGLRRIAGTGGGARIRARRTRWVVGQYGGLHIALQPDRSVERHGLKLVFYEQHDERGDGRYDCRKMAYILLGCENGMTTQGPEAVDLGGGCSAFRGMHIEEASRGRGLAKVLVGIWLRLCLVCGIAPRAAKINKPLLAFVLERHYGFVPAPGGMRSVVSDAVRRRDCRPAPRSDALAVHTRTTFAPPPLAELDASVTEVLRGAGGTLELEASVEALQRAMVGRQS